MIWNMGSDQTKPDSLTANKQTVPRPVYTDGADVWQYLTDRVERRAAGLPLGVPTPWGKLDEYLGGGFQPREVYVIGAPPSTGKSALAGRLARHVSAIGGRALYLSYEIEPAKIRLRALADIAGIRYDLLQSGRVTVDELREKYAAALALQTGAIGFLDCTQYRPTLDAIEAIAAQTFAPILDPNSQITAYNSLLIVDYLQLAARSAARAQGNSGDDLRVQVAEFSARMMTISRAVGVPVVQLASVNRASYEKPDLGAFKEAGDIESDTDNAWILDRAGGESWDEIRNQDVWQLNLKILKARNGKTGSIPIQFNRPLMRFTCEGE